MKETNFEFSVASDVDFEDLIADIGFDTQLVALLTQENGYENLRIRIFPPQNQEFWDFRLDEFQEVIIQARNRLWELRRSENLD